MPATANAPLSMLLNKVLEVTALCWIIKILSTTVGEPGADYLAVHVGLGTSTTTAIMVSFLLAALTLQLQNGGRAGARTTLELKFSVHTGRAVCCVSEVDDCPARLRVFLKTGHG